MGTMTKWPVQKHTEHHKTRSIQRRNRHKEITIFWVFDSSDFYFHLLKGLLQKMLNYRLGTVNEKHWGFKSTTPCLQVWFSTSWATRAHISVLGSFLYITLDSTSFTPGWNSSSSFLEILLHHLKQVHGRPE